MLPSSMTQNKNTKKKQANNVELASASQENEYQPIENGS